MVTRYFNDRGFTLVETICCLVIIGLVASVTIVQVQNAKAEQELDMIAKKMAMDIRRWQQKAVSEQETYRLVVDTTNKRYRFRQGIQTLETHNLGTKLKTLAATSNFTIVDLEPLGTTSVAGHYTLENHHKHFRYVIILNTTGRVRVSKTPP